MNNFTDIYIHSKYFPYDGKFRYFIYHPNFGDVEVDYNMYLKIVKISVKSDQDGKTVKEKMEHIHEVINELMVVRGLVKKIDENDTR
ncbi:MAG: hypothetical protein AMQ22_00609 [Candidatus Methanofastidiosum methylothiophilum]|uniref:Uncharacterized protein n=1 Tax=Candidatus Methanofastidiosum methylothiophilum TaxID=1705564 RepID=A0A150J6V0_9EURY|nr:MAG: hypothetical protein AMQ22_00609 [Candidatus Methanofastidiosum methylthiophilus]